MSSSPEKLGRSSKSMTKSPCSPHAVGDADVDAEVLVAVRVVLTDSEDEVDVKDSEDDSDELKDEGEPWLFEEAALLECEVVCEATVSDDENEVDDEAGAWPFAKEVPLEEGASELGVTEPKLGEVAVGGPLANELPMEDKACVLGVTELKLVLEALAAVLVISATPMELAAGELEVEEDVALSTGESAIEAECGGSAP